MVAGEVQQPVKMSQQWQLVGCTWFDYTCKCDRLTHTITFPTCFSAPTAAPQSVTASATGPKTISIDWNSADCIERNSQITGYTLQYNSTDGTETNTSFPANFTTYTVTGLTPSTNYSVKMAAINSNGEIGPFAFPIHVKTLPLASKCHEMIQKYYYS